MKIENYRFGEVIINGKSYTSDVIVFPDRVVQWWRKAGHAVAIADLGEVIKAGPEILIIGTGAYGAVRIFPEVENFMASKGVKLIAVPSQQACERYSQLNREHRVVLALHLTC